MAVSACFSIMAGLVRSITFYSISPFDVAPRFPPFSSFHPPPLPSSFSEARLDFLSATAATVSLITPRYSISFIVFRLSLFLSLFFSPKPGLPIAFSAFAIFALAFHAPLVCSSFCLVCDDSSSCTSISSFSKFSLFVSSRSLIHRSSSCSASSSKRGSFVLYCFMLTCCQPQHVVFGFALLLMFILAPRHFNVPSVC